MGACNSKGSQPTNQSTNQSTPKQQIPQQSTTPATGQSVAQPVAASVSTSPRQSINQPILPSTDQSTTPPLNRNDPGQQTTYFAPTNQPNNVSVNNQSINISLDQSNAPSPVPSKPATPLHQSTNPSSDEPVTFRVDVQREDEDMTIAEAETETSPINQSINQPLEVSTGDKSLSFWGLQKTVRPLKSLNGPSKSRLGATIQATMRATLGGGDLKSSVQLPPGENVNEWIAVNTVHFFNEACMIYGTCQQFCTPTTCPRMVAGKAEYLWQDNDQYKKPTVMPAPEYINTMLAWVDDQLNDETIFPTEEGVKFPRSFNQSVKQIYKRLFRLYAHIYCAHAIQIKSIGANAHLNTLFKHFIYFVQEFQLIDKQDLLPLDRLIEKIKAQDR